jgi:hypothetical protein
MANSWILTRIRDPDLNTEWYDANNIMLLIIPTEDGALGGCRFLMLATGIMCLQRKTELIGLQKNIYFPI